LALGEGEEMTTETLATATRTATYTWDAEERRFRDRWGRYVARSEVRAALDRYTDNLQAEVGDITEQLVAGQLDIGSWQLRMEALIKRGHVAATEIAKGGKAQVGPREWGKTGAILRQEYAYLARFARQLEDGRPVNGGTVARAKMYAIAPTATYENLLRDDDIANGFDIERRIRHSNNSCDNCVEYEDMGWQSAGVLPGIGKRCKCLTRCQCTFERMRSEASKAARRKAKMSAKPVVLDQDACDRRRRRAALRDSVEAAPVRLHKSTWLPATELPTLRFAIGTLPATTDEALAAINSLASARGGKALKAEDVYVHYVEAANSNFIGDRWMFLHETTLRNIANGGASGFAFMNSHRTGGLSSPSELPFGRTFAGRYEEHEAEGRTFKRALVGVYMVKGVHPNGSAGPSTDDMHSSIESGTLSDVSMGLTGGTRVCDLCAVDVEEVDDEGDYLCSHVPGTHSKMSDEDREAQVARGVEGGVASYSLLNASPQEVSAVFKGAVPGAGFRKAVGLASRRGLGLATGREIVLAYGPMLTHGERSKLRGKPMAKKGFTLGDLFRRAEEAPDELDGIELAIIERPHEGQGGANGASATDRTGTGTATPPAAPQALTDRERRALLREANMDAREYLDSMKGKFSPHEAAGFKAVYLLAALDDERNTGDVAAVLATLTDQERANLGTFKDVPVRRVDLLKLSQAHRSGHTGAALASGKEDVGDAEVLRPGERALPSVPTGEDELGQDMDATFALAATTPAGVAALKETPEGRAWCQKNGK
jgi:hypothetical protein